jgi:hypothetical protein
MSSLQLDEAINNGLARDLLKRSITDQSAAIELLEAVGRKIGATVDAGPLDVVAQERCANDTAHGPGTCVFPGTDGLCPACTVGYIQRCLVAGDYLSIDVLL